MKHFLIVVDMQNDFVDGALGSAEAVRITENVVNEIRNFDGELIATFDTHFPNYMETAEGKKLPVPHCIKGTDGWRLTERVQTVLNEKEYTAVEKVTFGSVDLPAILREKADGEEFDAELIGLCTDICVVSNALLLKAHFPEYTVRVNAGCCAGVSAETHEAALATMRCCQIEVYNSYPRE